MNRWFWFAEGIGYARTLEEIKYKIDVGLDKAKML